MVKASQPRRIDAYLRVSRVGERAGVDSYGSPDDQREAIRRWADYKRIEIAREHLDEDESGGTQERPALEAAIARALAGETDGIVAYDISRFSRFTEGGLRDLRRLHEAGARLVFATEEIDTSTTHGKMIYTILLATHEAALEQHKARWRVTKARGIREGRQIGPTPVGYTRARENGKHGKLVPHPIEGPAITRAYELAATEGLDAAIAHLQTAIPAKKFTVRKAASAQRYNVKVGESVTVPATWNPTTVRRLLAQRCYLGEAYYRYADGEELLNPSAHEPLVDLPTFTLAQTTPSGRRAPAALFVLSGGHARCASCGGVLAGSRSGAGEKMRRMYKCPAKDCPRRASVSADPLEQHVRELLVDAAHTALSQGTPEPDIPAARALEAGLREAEERRHAWANDESQRDRLGADAHAAVLVTYTRDVATAQAAYEAALQGVVDPLPAPGDVAEAPVEQLGSVMDRLGLVVTVEPGRGNLTDRVVLEKVPA